MSRYCPVSLKNKIVSMMLNIIKKHYHNFKDYGLKRKSLESFKYCFDKLIEEEKT